MSIEELIEELVIDDTPAMRRNKQILKALAADSPFVAVPAGQIPENGEEIRNGYRNDN